MYEDFKEFIFGLYKDFRNQGETYHDALAIVAYIVKNYYFLHKQPITYGIIRDFILLEKGNDYLRQNEQKLAKFYKLDKSEYTKAVKELIDEWEDQAPPDKRRTKPDVAKIIKALAKQLVSKGPFIDIAVGLGTLLEDMPGPVFGYDIDVRQVIVADAILTKSNERDFIFLNDSLNPLDNHIAINNKKSFFTQKGVFVFDPPMGDLRQKPDSWEYINTSEIIGNYSKESKTPSEILFLLSFLLKAQGSSYFIGLFPENILNRNNKEYNNLRKYLIENCLIAVIKAKSGHIILVGQKKLQNKNNIPVIRIENSINAEQLEFIVKTCLKTDLKIQDFDPFYNIQPSDYRDPAKDISLEKYNKEVNPSAFFKVYSREQLTQNDYLMSLPEKTLSSQEYQNPKILFENIATCEEQVKTLFNNLKPVIDNLETKQEPEKEKLWFEEEDNKVTKALRHFDSFLEKPIEVATQENIHKISMDLIKRQNSLDHLKTLFKNNRLKIEHNSIKINYKKDLPEKEVNISLFFNKFKPMNQDENIKKLIEMTDNNIQLIYEDICKYWLLDKNENETYLKNMMFSKKEIIRALRVLNELGLVIKNDLSQEEQKSEMLLYEEYRPYQPLNNELINLRDLDRVAV